VAFQFRPHELDAVITDRSMPRMSGFDFARSVREIRGSGGAAETG
jgi:CheY-like chemotaxis protein